MKSDNRISGIDFVGKIPWGTHFSQFYKTKEDLMDILVPYFKAGLENNEFCLWVVSESVDIEKVTESLIKAVPDIDFYLRKGQIGIIPYTCWYLKEGVIDPQTILNQLIEKANQALVNGYDGLRFSGDDFWIETNWQDLSNYDKILDSVTGNYNVIVLCTYFLNKCEADQIAEIASHHHFSLVKKDERWEKIENSGRMRAEEAEVKLKEILCKLENLVNERTHELEKAYNSLKEGEESLEEAQRMAHIGNWVWDINADKAYWSEELYHIFRRDPKELAPSYNEYLSYIHPDDRLHVYTAANKALNEKSSLSIDFRIKLADGEERTVHMLSETIFDEKNCPVRIKGIVQDITERKKTEEKIKALADIVESSNDAIITLSLEGIIINWNKAAEHIYGYSAEEILGKNVSILEPPKIKGEIKQLSEQIKLGEKIQQYETLRLKKDGSILNVSITLSPVFDSSGKLMAISGIVRNITRRIKAEKALAKAEEARIKEIHHRIKNNLQVISSLLDLQANKFSHLEVCKVSEVLEAFKESQNRVGSMALIHEELYKGDNIETLNFADYLLKLTKDLLNSYRVGRDNISLKLDLEQVYLSIDTAIPLGIIVNELVSNSLKHAFPNRQTGEIKISLLRTEDAINKEICEVSGKNEQKNGFYYSLKVSDNGKGILKEIDIKNTDTLGLQLVSILVEQIDGKIKLKRDQGTEFTIWFNNIEK